MAFHGGAQPHSLLDAHLNAGVEKGLDEQLAGVADDRELQADNAGDGIRPEGAQNAVLIPVLLRRERGSGLVDGVFPLFERLVVGGKLAPPLLAQSSGIDRARNRFDGNLVGSHPQAGAFLALVLPIDR